MNQQSHSLLLVVLIIVLIFATCALIKYGRQISIGPCNMCEQTYDAECRPKYVFDRCFPEYEEPQWKLDLPNGELPTGLTNTS